MLLVDGGIAAASASVTTNMPAGWERRRGPASTFRPNSPQHGRQCFRPWAAGRDPGQSAPRADWLLPGVDCLTTDCAHERTFAVAELASFYGAQRTVGEVLRRMRCAGGCGRPGRGRLAGDGADPQQARPAAPCATARASGEGVIRQPPSRPRPAPVVRPGGCSAQVPASG